MWLWLLAEVVLQTGGCPKSARPLDLLRLEHAVLPATLPNRWRVRPVRGVNAPTSALVDSLGERFLRVSGTGRAGWLVLPIEQQPPQGERALIWSWRVLQSPIGADLRAAATDDAAIRVFVSFDRQSAFARVPRTIFYSIGDGEPEGYERNSFVSADLHVVRVGAAFDAGRWTEVRVRPSDDYRRIWGRSPGKISAVGIMQDSDQTRSYALADLRTLCWVSPHAP